MTQKIGKLLEKYIELIAVNFVIYILMILFRVDLRVLALTLLLVNLIYQMWLFHMIDKNFAYLEEQIK